MKLEYTRSEYHKARAVVEKYRCSVCWGPLVERIVPGGGSAVECAKDDADCSKTGFVTAKYIERRHSEDHGDAQEARYNLPFLRPEPRSADDLITEITGG